MKKKLKVGDLCRVVQATGKLGPTLYIVDWIGDRGRCRIKEHGTDNKPQDFDTSLLENVSGPKMLEDLLNGIFR